MRKRLKRMAAVLMAVTMGLSVTACGGSESASESGEKTYKDVINIVVSQESPSLDLQKNTTAIGRYICNGTVFEKLVTLDKDGNPTPELCESYEANSDSSEFTFKLRSGVKFHDGTVMTADDVVASMNRWIEAFSTAKQAAGEARFEKVDDLTCKIKLAASNVTFVSTIASSSQQAIITTAKECANEDDKGFLKNYVGTGPYKFGEWQLNQYIRLDKFDDYVPYGDASAGMNGWAGYKHGYAKQLFFYYAVDEATRIAGLQTGQYDAMYSLTSDNYDMINNNSEFKTYKEQGGTTTLVFNKKQGLGTNLDFRKAVNTALNYNDCMIGMYGTFYEMGSSYMDADQAYWVSNAGSENYNINDQAKAKELLKQAGYNGETFKILAANNGFEKLAEVVRQQLTAVGINVEVTLVDWATFTSYRTDPNAFDMYVTSFASVPLPSQKVYYGPTYPGWTDDSQIASYLAEFNSAATLEAAKAAWDKLQAYSWETLPIINLGHYSTAYGFSAKLEGTVNYQGVYFYNARVAE